MERPIILKAHEVRGILDGRQTQLRRIVKEPVQQYLNKANGSAKVLDGVAYNYSFEQQLGVCPFGKAGDRLWAKETWANICNGEDGTLGTHAEYRADTPNDNYPAGWPDDEARGNDDAPKWLCSTCMPRWASRILLEIVSVRVERLQDISDADALSDGIEQIPFGHHQYHDAFGTCWPDAKTAYQQMWSNCYGEASVDANPWVWVIEFKRVDAA